VKEDLLRNVLVIGTGNDPHRTWTIGYRMAACELRRGNVDLGS
jgi:hypothetical protein